MLAKQQVIKALMLSCLLLSGMLPFLTRNAKAQELAPPSPPEPVFTIVFEVNAQSDGLWAQSKVEVDFAPGPVWHGTFGTNRPEIGGKKAEDTRRPDGLYKLRGGLVGLRPGETMCFGVARHKGIATSDEGDTVTQPDGEWTIEEDAARFKRTEDGGVLTCTPMIYFGEAPAYGLMTPGGYEYSGGDAQYQKLIRFHFTNEDLLDLSRVMKANSVSLESKDGTVRQSFKSTLTATPPEDETEVSVEMEKGCDYEQWIPQGNLDDPKEPGRDPLKIAIKVHKKGDVNVVRQAFLKISMPQVSKNKGVCGNWPKEAVEKEGLQFRRKEFPEKEGLLFKDATLLVSDILLESAMFRLHAHDFGAWGTLQVTATDVNGKPLKVKVRGKETADLSIPLDDNHNHIADAWEQKWASGLGGQETDDEDAKPTGDGDTGDALSLYEEYRGFKISGGAEVSDSGGRPHELISGYHVRTNPQVKDVFICDMLGYGTAAFRSSGLQVHLVKAEEFGPSKSGAFNTRIINPNRGAWSIGEQYVLAIESGDPGTGYVGEAIMKSGPSVPRDCQKVVVKALSTAGTSLMKLDEDGLVTITHELAHACNVKHHGTINLVEFVRSEQLSDHSVLNEPGQLSMAKDSAAGGDVHCYMAYQANVYENNENPTYWVWDAAGKRYSGTLYKKNSPRFAKYRFCDEPSTWEIGPGGPPGPGLGDCDHQFCVNHLKH